MLLEIPNAKQRFVALFETERICPKLYALCALRHIDAAAFVRLSKSIKADEVVSIQNGCCVEESQSGSLLEQISNGDYDSTFQHALKK
jgi:hypothetical protein